MKLRINLSKPVVLVTTIFSIGVNLVSPVMANEFRVIELYNDSQAIVDLSKGQQLRIKILSNPSTGYRWELKSPNDLSKCLKVKEKPYRQPNNTPNRVGTTGYQIWIIKSKCEAGSSELLRFEYIRVWEVNVSPTSYAELLIKN